MYKRHFLFGRYTETTGNGTDGLDDIRVGSADFFNVGSGYGFIRQEHVTKGISGLESLLGGGFVPRAADCDMQFEEKAADTENGVVLELPRYPLRFKILVPENGVYRITMKIAGPRNGILSLSVYTMRRNLISHNISVAPGETYTVSFPVHVCGYMPAASSMVLDEKAVTVSLIGDPAVISELFIENDDSPTLFIAGDSTLTDQPARYPYYPKENYGGWAQVLPSFLNGRIAVCNQAHSGLTATCFREDGHWDQIEGRMKTGDLFLIQFGHNDQKRRCLRADGGYSGNLRWYVNEVRSRGAFPIIVTPLSRSGRNAEGNLNDMLADYAQACLKVGQELNVPVIDLHQRSFDFLDRIGAAEALRYFVKGDVTHTNDFGSMKMAGLVVEAAEAAEISEITQYFAAMKPHEFIGLYSEETPDSSPNAAASLPISLPYTDIAGSPDLEWIQKAGENGLLDVCVMHLHPTDGLPRAQFMFLLSKALRMASKSFVTSRFSDVMLTDWESGLIHTAADELLLEAECLQTGLFRPDDLLTGSEAVSMVVKALHPEKERGLTTEQCLAEAAGLGLLYDGFAPDTFIPRGKILRLLVGMMQLLENTKNEMPSAIEIHPSAI